MQTKKISSNLRKRNSAHRLVMKSRQAQAAKATPAHPRLRPQQMKRPPIEKKGVLDSALEVVKKHPVYSLLGASSIGMAIGYFIRSKK